MKTAGKLNRSLLGLLLLGVVSVSVLFGLPESVETVSMDVERMDRYLAREAEKLRLEAYARIDTKEKLEAEKEALLREFRFMIGLDPLPERTPLRATSIRTIDRGEYTVEVLHYQSLPGFYVTANLYKPKAGESPFPAIVWGPGHNRSVYGVKTTVQEHAVAWVRAGYICLVVDPIEAAEIYSEHMGTYAKGYRDWYARGYSPIGVEVWNAMRSVDYLLTRPDVDGDKLTVNGVSGGGHLSWMAGAADNRFAAVQPVAGTADVKAHIEHDLQQRHCDCAYFINAYRHDWPTLAAIVAPRSLMIHNSTEDGYYPVEGYQRVYDRAKEIFGWYGLPDKVGLFEVPGPHAYTKEERVRAIQWSNDQLRGLKGPAAEKPFEPVPDEELSAFGGLPPADNINPGIHDLFIPTAKLEHYGNRADWERKKGLILEKLRTVVFRNLPKPYRAATTVKEPGLGENGFAMETEEGVRVGMITFVPGGGGEDSKQPALVYVASPDEVERSILWNVLRAYPWRQLPTAIHVVFPRGVGTESWDWFTTRHIRRSAMVLGRTLDDMRLYDVLCAIDYAAGHASFDGSEITVAGTGAGGIIGAYAALLDDRVSRVILHSPTLTHKSGPIFLNVLRYTDIPQALAMLAPRELVFLSHEIEQFDYTKSIYKLYGVPQKFRRGYSISQVLHQPVE